MTMRLGYDAKRAFDNTTGLGNYSRTLLESLVTHYPEHHYALYTPKPPRFAEAEAFAAGLRANPHVSIVQPPNAGAIWRTFGMGSQAAREGVQLFHGLSAELPRPLPRRVKAVVTIHDVIFLSAPHLYPALDRFFYRQKLLHACRRADAVVAISEATRDELFQFVPGLEAKTRVIYQSAGAWARTLPPRTTEPVGPPRLLYVGALTARKNVATVLEALRELPDVAWHFDIVGTGPEQATLAEMAKHPALAGRVQLHGRVPEDVLAQLFANATALVYPSVIEGFGIPILEGLYAGLPVVTSAASCLPEAGGDAALYCPPYEPAAWAEALRRVLTEPPLRAEMRTRGYAHTVQFEPAKIAAEWMTLYTELLGD